MGRRFCLQKFLTGLAGLVYFRFVFQHYDADRQEVTEETVFVPMKELADSRSMSESTSAISGMDYKVNTPSKFPGTCSAVSWTKRSMLIC